MFTIGLSFVDSFFLYNQINFNDYFDITESESKTIVPIYVRNDLGVISEILYDA